MARKSKPTKPGNENSPQEHRNTLMLVLGILMIIVISAAIFNQPATTKVVSFSAFMDSVARGQVKAVQIRANERLITDTDRKVKAYYIDYPDLVKDLRAQNVTIDVNPADSGAFWNIFIQLLLPILLVLALWFFIFRQAQGANNQALSFGKSRAVPWKRNKKEVVTFKDVAGVDEAVEELREIVDFLAHPERYQELGAKIPKGALLMGPPGTGKTLLAKAIAGEADVPFFSLSGSDFVEMFVGVGASRVRDLFGQAKKSAPCIIFVDEIDAVGRHRGAGLGGGHDEREQTLNALLVEMDGFDPKQTIIVIAATNRPDILDPALLRPGRFDRQIVVDKPDIKGREDILKIHAKEKKMGHSVDLKVVARQTAGFTGADLANLVNEAALLTARKGKKKIEITELEESTERVIAGPQRKSRLISEKEKDIVAFHEVGHALVAKMLPNADPVHKITILPRGLALGYTLQLPVEDKHLVSREEIEDQIKVLYGGRIAEELIFNMATSGASNDIEKATDLARSFVCRFGMNERLGPRKYGKAQEHVFLGRDWSDHSKDYSEQTASAIDEEINGLMDRCYSEARRILTENMDKMMKIVAVLKEKEVIDSSELDDILGIPRKEKPEESESKKVTVRITGGPKTKSIDDAAADQPEAEHIPAPEPEDAPEAENVSESKTQPEEASDKS